MTAHKQTSTSYAYNRKARYDFIILETVEAGIDLSGNEVKSVRAGHINLRDSYIRVDRREEAWLINCHISPYQSHEQFAHADPTRRRKLLLHRSEIKKMMGQSQQKGLTIVPLSVYSSHGKIKLEIGLAKGKKLYDKKETLKRRDIERDAQRDLRHR
jgi:SsrA-binding protein